MFIKYPHLERFGTDEVDGINVGTCHVFPKIDGTNASVWMDEGLMRFGSRNRELTRQDDNAGFANWAWEQRPLRTLLLRHPSLRLYGEWLVPHSLKTYREDAWRKFYVFDVMHADGTFLNYDAYSDLLSEFGVDFIPCMTKAINPTYEVLLECSKRNLFLIEDGKGVGEGIVIKQYGWTNRFQRTTWAKLITNTFRDEHIKVMGGSVHVTRMVEEDIAEEFVTKHSIDKIVAKIRTEKGQFGSKDIPQLLGTAFHELVVEELWNAIKKHKNPKIDFKTLNTFVINRVKALMPELFGRAA